MNSFNEIFKEQTSDYLKEMFPTGQQLINLSSQEIDALNLRTPEKKKLLSYLSFAQDLLAPKEEQVLIRTAKDVFDYLSVMQYYQEERFVVLCLNTKNRIMSQIMVSKGTLNSVLVHPREVFTHAIRLQCNAIIAVHSHPSGDPEPSVEDISITKQLVDSGTLLGINLLDHVIIGSGKFVSLKERGLLG